MKNYRNSGREIDGISAIILLLFGIYGVFSHSFFLSILGGFTLVAMMKVLWKEYTPPVLLFFLVFDWVQIFSSIVYADYQGLSLDEAYESTDTQFLLIMTFLQLIIMALVGGHILRGVKVNAFNKDSLVVAARQVNVRNVIIGYFVSALITPVVLSFINISSALFQLAQTLSILKFIFLGMLFFVALLTKTPYRRVIVLIILVDFILSFVSFFSDFKGTILLVIIGYFTVYPKVKASVVLRIAPIFIALFIFFSFWSFIKTDYRRFLNQGTQAQEVNVSNKQALIYLFSKFEDINSEAIRKGGQTFLSRAQYMERYIEVYNRVPSVIEHQGGNDFEDAISFILIPRFLNPNKGYKDASIRTSYYTGKDFRSAVSGTSISMGYFCDLYIDYGLYVMILPLIIIISVISYIMKYVLEKKGYNVLFTYSLLIGVFLYLGLFESDIVFFLGTIRGSVAFLVLGYFVFFPKLHKLLITKS